ncbi:MAG: DUF5131 family protein [Vicinamibacterales bacterium]
MSAVSSIEWTDRTWNPVRGCSVVSPGCINCYAMKFAHRFSGPDKPYEGLTKQTAAGPQWTGAVRLVEEVLADPLRWRRPARVFVNSMSDLFHEAVPDEFIDHVFTTMALARQHTFQILTKRPERMRAYCARRPHGGESQFISLPGYGSTAVLWQRPDLQPWPLPNVWLGVSVENQATADARIPLLLDTPAAVRFVSYEPALGPVDFMAIGKTHETDPGFSALIWTPDDEGPLGEAVLDWVIVGGESGPHARPCALEWVESTIAQCRAAGVPVFVKQLGGYVVSEQRSCRDAREMRELLGADARWPDHRWLWRAGLTDRKGGDPVEWPEGLRVRQFPEARG